MAEITKEMKKRFEKGYAVKVEKGNMIFWFYQNKTDWCCDISINYEFFGTVSFYSKSEMLDKIELI